MLKAWSSVGDAILGGGRNLKGLVRGGRSLEMVRKSVLSPSSLSHLFVS